MKILFDHQIFSLQKYGGISLYINMLKNGINKHSNHNARVSIPGTLNEKGGVISEAFWSLSTSSGYRTKNIYCMLDWNFRNYDVFHATYYDPYFIKLLKNKSKFTVTFHDMVHEKLSSRFPEINKRDLMLNKALLIKKANRVIAISESTKTDIINIYNIDPEKVEVIYHGNPFDSKSLEKMEKTAGKYLLYVGNRWHYKNFKLLIKSVANILIKYQIHLYCAGGGDFNKEEHNLINSLHINALVKYKQIENDNLPAMYNSAIAFIFPSMYEGFGFPILEAFTCECPCILSNCSAFKEVAGEAAIYFDPNKEDSIKESILKVLDNESLRHDMITKGLFRLQMFSWRQTVQKTLNFYKSL